MVQVLRRDHESAVAVQVVAELMVGVPDQMGALGAGKRHRPRTCSAAFSKGRKAVGQAGQVLSGIRCNLLPLLRGGAFQSEQGEAGVFLPALQAADSGIAARHDGLQRQAVFGVHHDGGVAAAPAEDMAVEGDEDVPVLDRREKVNIID